MLLNLNWLVSHFDYPLQNANILDIVTARQDFIPAKMDVKVPYSLQLETLQVMMRFTFNKHAKHVYRHALLVDECESHHYLKCFPLEWVGNLDIHLCRNKILTAIAKPKSTSVSNYRTTPPPKRQHFRYDYGPSRWMSRFPTPTPTGNTSSNDEIRIHQPTGRVNRRA